MRRSLLILILSLNALAFLALTVGMVFVADAPKPAFYALVGSLAGLLLSVAGLSAIVLISTVRRPRGLPLDPDDAAMVHVPPPGVSERRQAEPGRRATDVGPSDIVRIAHAIKLSAGSRGAPISEAIARQQGLLDPLDLEPPMDDATSG